MSGLDIDTRRSFEHLHDSLFALDFEDLTAASRAVRKRKSHDFVVRGELENVGVQFPPKHGGGAGRRARGGLFSHFNVIEDNQRSGKRWASKKVSRRTGPCGNSPIDSGDGAII